jgi:hypothetical protein
MNAILARWATPLTLGLFLVSAISGAALAAKGAADALTLQAAATASHIPVMALIAELSAN